MKQTDLAYIAGILDGEGSISITNRSTGIKLQGHSLSVSVINTNEWICKWLHFNLGGYCRVRVNGLGWGKRDIWEWNVQARKALYFLELVLPYLRIKRPQAELAILFQGHKKKGQHKNPEDKSTEEEQRLLMHNYNSGKAKSRDESKRNGI